MGRKAAKADDWDSFLKQTVAINRWRGAHPSAITEATFAQQFEQARYRMSIHPIRRVKGISIIGMLLTIPVLLLVVLLLAISFYETRKAYWDYQVREMCARDGGIKLYEKIKLPASSFNEWGQVSFYRPTQKEAALGSEYIFQAEEHFYRRWNPSVIRYHHQVIRRSDGKILGETTSYGRGGGDLPGPWEPSNYHCPPTSNASEIVLFKNIFVLSGTE